MKQAWTQSKGMQEQISKFKARGLYIITVPGIEEDRIRDRKV